MKNVLPPPSVISGVAGPGIFGVNVAEIAGRLVWEFEQGALMRIAIARQQIRERELATRKARPVPPAPVWERPNGRAHENGHLKLHRPSDSSSSDADVPPAPPDFEERPAARRFQKLVSKVEEALKNRATHDEWLKFVDMHRGGIVEPHRHPTEILLLFLRHVNYPESSRFPKG